MHPNAEPSFTVASDNTTRSVLQVGRLLPELAEALQKQYAVEVLPLGEERDEFLASRGATFEAVVTTARVGVNADLMRQLPGIGAIVHFGVGYDSTDVMEARARGIGVSNTPDVLTDCVADFAVGAMLDLVRGITAADRFVRRGDWSNGGFPLTTKIGGKRVGVLGLGRIGQAVARRLTGFNVALAYHSRHQVECTDLRYVGSPRDLADWCDVLVVTAAGGSATAGLVSGEVLDALGPDGYLVNVSRGTVVDEAALVDRLLRGGIAGAALDVFVNEPNVPPELMDKENVLLLPHTASGTRETRHAMAQLVLDNLAQFLADGSLKTPVP